MCIRDSQKDVRFARKAGLHIENIHTPVHEQNCLSLDNLDGDSVFQSYLQCVKDCFEYNIPTMVIHLPNDESPINNLGIKRLEKIISEAEKLDVKIAFENLCNIQNLELVLGVFHLSLIHILPELLRGLNDYRMLIYAILLIVMMIFNNSGLKTRLLEKRAARRAGDPQKKTELSDKEEV